MADTPVFQGHHVIEQQAFRDSKLLQALSKQGLFDLDGSRNMLNLPANQALAANLGVSPHTGGPLSDYSQEVRRQLTRLQSTADGQATLRGDQAAAQRIAARVNGLTDTLKVGLVNGDLVSNTPQGMTPEQANARIRTFFGDLDGYQRTHAAQIAELRTMSPSEARWAAVTRSEGNVRLALDAIDQPGMSTLSDRWGSRSSLGTAIADANQAGRLPLSESLEVRLRATFPQQMPPTLVRPPTMTPGIAPEGVVPESGTPRGMTPGSARALRVAGVAGGALMAYDLIDTGHRVVQLRAEGNEAGAASAQTHFVGRNAGGIVGGFLLGAGYGAATGSWTGPGAIATGLIGGIGGAYLGDRWAEQRDIDRVYSQTDRSGNEWTRNPEDPQGAWTRSVRAPTPDGGYRETRLIAAGRLADGLNYRAANDSYSLGLANPPAPQNPYRLDASAATEPRAPFETGRDYVRDAQTGQWQLEIRENLDGHIPISRNEPIGPERATELEQQSQAIIAQNAANTPTAIAARYQIAFNQFGWNEFAAQEPVPPVIANARAQTQTLRASDGNTYTRDANGEWSTPGMVYGTNQATGNVREELNRTWESQQVGLRDMAVLAEEARANPTPTQSDLRSQVAGAYARAGVTRSDAQIDAATEAVTQTHARDGVTQSQTPFYLQLQGDGSIATVSGQNDNRMEVRSVTTAAEIAQAQTRQQAPPDLRQPDAPAPAITPAGDAAQPSAPAPQTPMPEPAPIQQPGYRHGGSSSSGVPGNHDATREAAAAAQPQVGAVPPRRQTALESDAVPGPALPAGFAPALKPSTDLRDPDHPGRDDFARTLSEVHRAETTAGIPHGAHSEQVAAALMLAAWRNGHGITNVEICSPREIVGLQRGGMSEPVKEVSIDSNQALSLSMEQYAAQWAQLRSPHYASRSPEPERTPEQARALTQLSPRDQALFARIRQDVPGHIADDVIAHAMLQAKQNGISGADKIEGVGLAGDRLCIAGTTPGFRTMVDVSTAPPELSDTLHRNQAFNQERQLAMEAAQREQQQTQGRGFSV